MRMGIHWELVGRQKNAPIGAMSQDDAAAMLNICRHSVQRARCVIDDGVPEVSAAVDAGSVKVSAAAGFVKQPRSNLVATRLFKDNP